MPLSVNNISKHDDIFTDMCSRAKPAADFHGTPHLNKRNLEKIQSNKIPSLPPILKHIYGGIFLLTHLNLGHFKRADFKERYLET